MSAAAILAPLQLAVGDLLGRTVAQNQPAKLAAIEGQFQTEHGAGDSTSAASPSPVTSTRSSTCESPTS